MIILVSSQKQLTPNILWGSVYWYALSFLAGSFEILNIFGNPGGSNDTRLTAKKCIFSFTTGFFCKKKNLFLFTLLFFLNLLFTLRNKEKKAKICKKAMIVAWNRILLKFLSTYLTKKAKKCRFINNLTCIFFCFVFKLGPYGCPTLCS